MGSGRWDTLSYARDARARRAAGEDDFSYSARTLSAPRHARKIHALLDPLGIRGVREARDSAEHPESVPVAALFDVTGSMGMIPRIFQEKLPKLMTLLNAKAGLAHPQVLFGAIGDATCDQFPFQVGQFESDNRCDEQLRNVILEGGGGGQKTESYELALYFGGYKVALDCVEKRGRRGYLFTMGDERFYPAIPRSVIHRVFGDRVQDDLAFRDVLAAARRNFEYFHIHCQEGSYRDDRQVLGAWRDAIGQNLLLLEDSRLVCELVASTIALAEGATWDDLRADLGSDADCISTAVQNYGPNLTARVAEVEGLVPTSSRVGSVHRL